MALRWTTQLHTGQPPAPWQESQSPKFPVQGLGIKGFGEALGVKGFGEALGVKGFGEALGV